MAERDLGLILAGINAIRRPGTYVFARLADGDLPEGTGTDGLRAEFEVVEAEGRTLVLRSDVAERAGLVGSVPSAWITLQVHSDLEAVGFLAVVLARLAGAGMSVNVASGYHHDHIFVPVGRADEAIAIIGRIQEGAGPVSVGALAVRPARLQDLAAMCALWNECGLAYDPQIVGVDLASSLRIHPELVLVATDPAKEIIGSVWATYDGRRGWLQKVAVSPAFRHRKLGSALIGHAENRLAALGATKINLLIEGWNGEVVPFYQSLGYTRRTVTLMDRRIGT